MGAAQQMKWLQQTYNILMMVLYLTSWENDMSAEAVSSVVQAP